MWVLGRELLSGPIGASDSKAFLFLPHPQALRHLFVQEPFPGTIGLNPFAIDHELGNGALAGTAYDLFSGTGRRFDVDLGERQIMSLEKAFGLPAIGTPEG